MKGEKRMKNSRSKSQDRVFRSHKDVLSIQSEESLPLSVA